MGEWFADVIHAWRRLRSTPVFTLFSVLTLALGIGATTAIYSVVYAAVLRPPDICDINGVSDGWSGFYRKYPHSTGFIQMSAVGFDSARSRAMVYVAYHCGGLCGSGTHHLLERIDGSWRKAELDVSNCRWDS